MDARQAMMGEKRFEKRWPGSRALQPGSMGAGFARYPNVVADGQPRGIG